MQFLLQEEHCTCNKGPLPVNVKNKRYRCPYLAELFEFPAQSEGSEDGVFAGQRDEGRRGQSLVDVESRPRMPKTVDLQEETQGDEQEDRGRFITFKAKTEPYKTKP